MSSSTKLGPVVQQAAIFKGMTLGELASETLIREDVLRKFVYGQRSLTTEELERIMDKLDLVLASPGASPQASPPPPPAATPPGGGEEAGG